MLNLYGAKETNFDHNEAMLKDILKAEVTEDSNGIFAVDIEYPLTADIQKGMIIKCPTPRGDQLFRIVKPTRILGAKKMYKAYARHIFYDLLDNFIEDSRPTNIACQGALQTVLGATSYGHSFYGVSDIAALGTAYYIRQNPVQSIMGDKNSILNVWGGHLNRDNFKVEIKQEAQDRGYEVKFGKNLIGLDEEIDMSDVVTRIYPTTVINDSVVTALPEKYVDSPLMDTYPHPIIRELRVELSEDEKVLPLEDIYALLRQAAIRQYELRNDEPLINYKVDFIHYTTEKENIKILRQLDINDLVTINVASLGLNLKAKVIRYTYDGIRKKYASMELGNFKTSLSNQKIEIKESLDEINNALQTGNADFAAIVKAIGDMIMSNNGGYKVDRFNNLGQPFETLYMDSLDMATATNVLRLNQNGIGFSTNGYNGPFNVAITIDGKINGQYIIVNSLSAISADLGEVTTGRLRSPDGTLEIDLNDKIFKLGSEGESVNTGIKYDGMTIKDGDKVISAFGAPGANIPELKAERVIAPQVMQKRLGGTYTVGFDATSTFGSIQEAFDSLFIDGIRFLEDQILLLVYGNHSGDVYINDIYGGPIIIRLMDGAKFYGTIDGKNIYTSLKIEKGGAGRGFVDGGSNYPFNFNRCFNVMVEGIDWAGNTVGLYARASNVITRDCDLGTNNFYYGYIAEQGSVITAINNRGRATGNRAETRNGIIYQQGEVPGSPLGDSNKGGNIINTSLVETSSSYDIPPVTAKEFKRLFVSGTFDTLNNNANPDSYYGATAAQNRWLSSMGNKVARIRSGSAIKDFIVGGTGVSIRMRLRRANTSHGSSGVVAPDPRNFSCSMSGALQGAWSGWGIVSSAVFGDTVDLRLGNDRTGSTYAIWDAIEIEVTVTKNI